MLLGCASPDPDPEMVLAAELAPSHGDIAAALATWSAAFPGCPHAVAEVRTVDPEEHTTAIVLDESVHDIDAQATWSWRTSGWNRIRLSQRALDGDLVAVLLHELGHAHGAGHRLTGIMAERPSAFVGDGDVVLICEADPECCDG